MANHQFPLGTVIAFLLLALAIKSASSARILDEEVPAVPSIAPAVTPDLPETPVPTVTPAAATTTPGDHPLTFFMHDILGGTNPTARAMTGIVTNPAVNGQVPFAKPNGAVLPVNNGVPVNNGNSAILNNNNVPFLIGLGGSTSSVMQNNGNNNNFNNGGFGFMNGVSLPSGTALQKLMFGTLTAFDDELTEGHERGSGLVGKAQGFYVASSVDGTSQTLAFTVMFESGGYADSISFFGVHRTVVSESVLAVMGGTGKHVNAKGFATVKTFPAVNGQFNSDGGAETVVQISVFLTY